MKVRCIELAKVQQFWVCEVTFSVTTSNQFTDEVHSSRETGRFILTALWNGWRTAAKKASALRAKPGERKAQGWAE